MGYEYFRENGRAARRRRHSIQNINARGGKSGQTARYDAADRQRQQRKNGLHHHLSIFLKDTGMTGMDFLEIL